MIVHVINMILVLNMENFILNCICNLNSLMWDVVYFNFLRLCDEIMISYGGESEPYKWLWLVRPLDIVNEREL